MSHIPPELLSDILSRLPVKPLLRFRSVSQSWNSLIHSPTFIQAHFTRQRYPNSDFKLIIMGHNFPFNSNSPTKSLSIDFSSLSSANSIPLEELDPPLKQQQPNGVTQVLGSYHGLVLICNKRWQNNDISMDGDYGLWNPSTRMFWKLPVCHSNPPQGPPAKEAQICGGFGLDRTAHDYKAVKISQWYHYDDNRSSLISEIMAYSLKLDLWRKVVQDCPYWLVREEDGMFAGGALYWLACEGRPPFPGDMLFLIRFDLGSERFDPLPFPDKLNDPMQLNLALLGDGCLCLLCSYEDDEADMMDYLSHVDIWGTKDCGQHWVKMFSVKQLNGPQHFNFVKPIAYLHSAGEVLLEIDNEKFMWYSLIKKSLRPVKINVGLDYFKSFVCLETLVPLYGGSNEKAKKKIEPNEENVAKKLRKETSSTWNIKSN